MDTIFMSVVKFIISPILLIGMFFNPIPFVDENVGASLPQATGVFETSLAVGISSSATSMTLTANAVRGGGAISGYTCFTVDEGSAEAEVICGTVSSTAVTSLTRGVSYADGKTAVTANQFAHRRGANVKITDFPIIQILKGQNNGDETFEAALSYASGVTPSAGGHFTDKEYVDSVVNGGTISYDQIIVAGTAGTTIATGELLYFDTVTTNEWLLADADATAKIENVQLGIAQGAGTDGNAITVGVLISGLDTNQTGMTQGDVMFASDTAGAIASSAGTLEVTVGIARTATNLYFNPRFNQQLTEDQQDALAGSSGTPSASNKYVTDDDPSLEADKGKTLTAGATINGATLPVPVFQNDSDNEFYAADANDTAAMKYLGFAITNGTDGNSIDVQFNGIVPGFTGLTEGEKYYVSDTVGTIANTIGTNEILVGVAISETELMIQKGSRHAHGVFTLGTSVSNQAVVTGFTASKIRITGGVYEYSGGESIGTATLSYTNGTYAVMWHYVDTNGTVGDSDSGTGSTTELHSGIAANFIDIGLSTFTDTGFTITLAETGTFVGDGQILWEAEGEL